MAWMPFISRRRQLFLQTVASSSTHHMSAPRSKLQSLGRYGGFAYDFFPRLRYMPPTSPMGVPCISIVFARAIVHGEDHGVKPFLVPLNDGQSMCPGVECKYDDKLLRSLRALIKF